MAAKGICDLVMQNPAALWMGDTERERYFAAIRECIRMTESTLCYVCDWFLESLPLENAEGLSLELAWNDMVSLTGSGETPGRYPPRENYGTAPAERVLIFPDSFGYCDGIVRAAKGWGRVASCELVRKAPEKIGASDVQELLRPGWDVVIFACGIDTPADNEVETVIRHQDALVRLYLFLVQGIMRNPDGCKRLACVTCDIFASEPEIHEEVGVGLVTAAKLFGLTNSARLELDTPIQFIDTEWALRDESVPLLASEIFRLTSFGKDTVRILNSGRYVQRQLPAMGYRVPGSRFEMPEGGIIAISGGNGALAMVMGNWLLDQVSAKQGRKEACCPTIKFVSRSAKISEQNLPGWKVIEWRAQELGVAVEQVRCDISLRASLESFVAGCTPRLTGFIHAAGVLQDAMLFNQTWEKYEMVFDPKSRAALYLHDALERHRNPDLRFLWLFSSTAVYGNPSATNYSAANAYLDALARHRCAMGLVGRTIQWGSWAEAGMAAQMTGAARDRIFSGPQPPFYNEEGLRGMQLGLQTALPYFGVLRWSGEALVSMSFAGGTPTQVLGRNFTSRFVPDCPPQLSGERDIYSRYIKQFGLGDEGLVHRSCVGEALLTDQTAKELWAGGAGRAEEDGEEELL